MSRQIASFDLGGSAVDRVMDLVRSGADEDEIARAMAGEEFGATDDEFGGGVDDEAGADFGTDVSTVLAAMQGESGDDIQPADVGLDDDATGDDVLDGVQKLLSAAAAGDEDAFGAVRRAARKIRGRRGGGKRAARPGAPRARPPARPAARPNNLSNVAATAPKAMAQIAAVAAGAMNNMSGLNKDLKRVLSRLSPGEGPRTPVPINLPGGFADVVNPGVQARIVVRPPKDMILSDLIIPGEFASRFVINALSVQGDPVFANEGFISAEQFRPDSTRGKLPHVWADGGKDIVLVVTNITAAASQFWGQFLGDEGSLQERQARSALGV